MEPTAPTVTQLLTYMLHLFQSRRLAVSSIGVHRSAIATLTAPAAANSIGAHPLVARFMRAAFLTRPPAAAAIRPTWDVADLLEHLKQWGPVQTLDFTQLTHRTLALVALASIRRIDDLTLLDISKGHMAITQTTAVFQLKFGLKQARPNHTSPVIKLLATDEEPHLCPVAHIRRYIADTAELRSSSRLFVTTTPPHGAAAKATLRTWLIKTMRGAGINDSPGSTRAAAASYAAATRLQTATILKAGDWAKARTMFKHYVRKLPHSTLQKLAEDTS